MDKPGWLSKQLSSAHQTVEQLPTWMKESYSRSTEATEKKNADQQTDSNRRSDRRDDNQT